MNGMLRGLILLGALLITVITGAFAGEKSAGTLEAGGRACIRPTLIRLAPGDSQAFRVVMAPRRLRSAMLAERVRWAVDDVPGGNARLGTIDSEGVYRAPASAAESMRSPRVCGGRGRGESVSLGHGDHRRGWPVVRARGELGRTG